MHDVLLAIGSVHTRHAKSIFCCAKFSSTIALDLQQKLKPVLHSSKEQMTMRSFLRIFIGLSCS